MSTSVEERINSFEEKINSFLDKQELNKSNNDYYQQTQDFLEKYNQILNEPEMKSILGNFNSLKSKYNFTCELLLDGLYSNQKYTLFESHNSGPFVIDIINPEYSFLGNKIFNSIDDIKKELLKENIRLLSNNDPNNFTYINDNKAIFRCVHCKSFCKKSFKSCDDYQFFENKHFDNIRDFNNFFIKAGCNIYQCINCNKMTVPNEVVNLLYKLSNTSVSVKLMNVTSSTGGSISIVKTEGTIRKVN
jgi:hypothetical protein